MDKKILRRIDFVFYVALFAVFLSIVSLIAIYNLHYNPEFIENNKDSYDYNFYTKSWHDTNNSYLKDYNAYAESGKLELNSVELILQKKYFDSNKLFVVTDRQMECELLFRAYSSNNDCDFDYYEGQGARCAFHCKKKDSNIPLFYDKNIVFGIIDTNFQPDRKFLIISANQETPIILIQDMGLDLNITNKKTYLYSKDKNTMCFIYDGNNWNEC